MDFLFRPPVFKGNLNEYPPIFVDEANQDKPDQTFIVQKIKEKLKNIEQFYPSLPQIYHNLKVMIRDEFEKSIKSTNRFQMVPLSGDEKFYQEYTSDIPLDKMPPQQLFNFLDQHFEKMTVEQYPILLNFGLSPSTHTLSKLAIISKLIATQTNFPLNQKIQKGNFQKDANQNEEASDQNQLVTEYKQISDHPLEKWKDSKEISYLIGKTKNNTIYIESLEGLYIILQNTVGRYIFDINSKKYYFNNEAKPISDIYQYDLVDTSIIDGHLVFIGLNNYEIVITRFNDDQLPNDDNECEEYNIGETISMSESSIRIIEDKLYLYTTEHEIVIYNLNDMNIIEEEPRYYLFSHVNFSNDEIFQINFNKNELFIDTRKLIMSEKYLTMIRPSFAISSYETVSLIIDDILQEMMKTFCVIIKGENCSNNYAENPEQHVDYALQVIKDLEDKEIPRDLMNFLNVFLTRFFVLNCRQIYSINKMVNDRDQQKITAFFGRIVPNKLLLETYDILIRTVKYGMYWPFLVENINYDYLKYNAKVDLFKLPQSIFLYYDISIMNCIGDEEQCTKFILQRINDMYQLVQLTRNININQNVSFYDKEFTSFINFAFDYLKTLNLDNKETKATVILEQLFAVLSVIPMSCSLAECVLENLKEISEEKSNIAYKISLFDKSFKNFMKYLMNFATRNDNNTNDFPCISMNTTILALKIYSEILKQFWKPLSKKSL
ncbi:hypothetical protein TVAG_050140 [Trichomonas vaginalis G3]|uniref:Uncharacterized protein n=1 Tax=Trichomonas vaginalis (strain ATCC PRA-98 / G3) TaxID=412133 RepID=A2EJE2_TRIV3|nr:hypothetical protein TVAG_050140 [Trichomonas vaginalis G3]|eukprot:XP_001319422.1 hypothetical protein [Trichomonas vaginalis G3]